jgi:hypothetical protein
VRGIHGTDFDRPSGPLGDISSGDVVSRRERSFLALPRNLGYGEKAGQHKAGRDLQRKTERGSRATKKNEAAPKGGV